MTSLKTLMPLLERIATALERAAPPAQPAFDPNAADAFLWGPERRLTPVRKWPGWRSACLPASTGRATP